MKIKCGFIGEKNEQSILDVPDDFTETEIEWKVRDWANTYKGVWHVWWETIR